MGWDKSAVEFSEVFPVKLLRSYIWTDGLVSYKLTVMISNVRYHQKAKT